MRPSEQTYAFLVALSLLDCDVYLLDGSATSQEIDEIGESNRFDHLIDPDREIEPIASRGEKLEPRECDSSKARVTIFTSGSTGKAKAVAHGWDALSRTVRKARGGLPQRWLLTYRPHLYAGLQVFLHCLLNQETLVLPDPGMAAHDLLAFVQKARVCSVSATPSYWRRLLTQGNRETLKALDLEQITLGGEIADQALLDALRLVFPGARVVHIYATSELGRCFSVKDGISGFPARFLETASDEGVELKLHEGELHVRTCNAMLERPHEELESPGHSEGWRATGDQVERIGERCYFVGRRSDFINVGGNKVQPLRVEQVIQAVPGVHDVRVFGKRSSLVGEMVACEFVVKPEFDPEQVKQAILATCLDRLQGHERPRLVQPVPAITLSNAGKKVRRQS